MPEIISSEQIIPELSGQQNSASYYFYTTYDASKHFNYAVAFQANGTDIDNEETLKNKKQAFIDTLEYHLSFEQVLPTANNDFITFYRPIYKGNQIAGNNDSKPLDYEECEWNGYHSEDLAKVDYVDVTEEKLLKAIVPLPTKVRLLGQVQKERSIPESGLTPEMSVQDLATFYGFIISESSEPYFDATRWNKHCSNCATYCRIERPVLITNNGTDEQPIWRALQAVDEQGHGLWYGNPEVDPIIYKDTNNQIIKTNDNKYPVLQYFNGYEFKSIMNSINQNLQLKLPTEDGWYRYDKITRKWEFLCKIEPTIQLKYQFKYADGTLVPNSD